MFREDRDEAAQPTDVPRLISFMFKKIWNAKCWTPQTNFDFKQFFIKSLLNRLIYPLINNITFLNLKKYIC